MLLDHAPKLIWPDVPWGGSYLRCLPRGSVSRKAYVADTFRSIFVWTNLLEAGTDQQELPDLIVTPSEQPANPTTVEHHGGFCSKTEEARARQARSTLGLDPGASINEFGHMDRL